jgi:hypothetical protein
MVRSVVLGATTQGNRQAEQGVGVGKRVRMYL